MTNNKEKYAFWLTPDAKKMIEINAPLANCGSQSEFVEKAVRFYDGYLKVQNAGAFLPHAAADVLEGTLGVFANRMAKLLFNLTVEHNITNHLLAANRIHKIKTNATTITIWSFLTIPDICSCIS